MFAGQPRSDLNSPRPDQGRHDQFRSNRNRPFAPIGHPRQGLYDPAFEHDACGVAFVATLTGEPSHDIVVKGLTALRNLDHRGATGKDAQAGDGAGILIQVPDEFLRSHCDFELPSAGTYAVGNAFLPTDPEQAAKVKQQIAELAAEESLTVLGWREVPVEPALLSEVSLAVMPHFEQLLLAATGTPIQGLALERMVFCLRRRVEHETGIYFPSLSSRTLVYKGMLTTEQLELVFPELQRSLRSRARWRSSTPGSPPTPSRPGNSPTRTG